MLIADGGDFLSFARVGLSASTYLDPGSLGCIGVGTPFGIAASLAYPDRQVVVATGDGAFGFNAMEIDTAARHKAPMFIVVANNGAWQIEVHDQPRRTARWSAPACSPPTMRRWRAPSACTASALSGRGAARRSTCTRAGQPAGAARRARHAGGGVLGRQVRARLGARPAAARSLGRRRAKWREGQPRG